MKVEFKTVDELRAFVRGTMLTKMYASVASMKQCGACEEAIEELVADTMEKRLNAMLIEDRPGNRRVLIDFFAMR